MNHGTMPPPNRAYLGKNQYTTPATAALSPGRRWILSVYGLDITRRNHGKPTDAIYNPVPPILTRWWATAVGDACYPLAEPDGEIGSNVVIGTAANLTG